MSSCTCSSVTLSHQFGKGYLYHATFEPRSGQQTGGCLRHKMTAAAPAARPGRGRTLPSLCTSGNRLCCCRGYVSFVERLVDEGKRFTLPISVAIKVHACVIRRGNSHPLLPGQLHPLLIGLTFFLAKRPQAWVIIISFISFHLKLCKCHPGCHFSFACLLWVLVEQN